MEVRVAFNNNTSSVSDGRIVVTIIDEDGIVTPGIRLKLGITSPIGAVIKAFPVSPDVTIPSSGSNTWTYDIPINTDGTYEQGVYTFQYEIDTQTGPITAETKTYQYSTQQKKGVALQASIATSYVCNSSTITVVDKTAYGSSVIDARTLSILPPNVPGYPAPSLATGIGPSFTTTFLFENAVYQCAIFTVAKVVVTDGVFVATKIESYSASFSQVIFCSTGVCALTACMDAELAKIEADACLYGGIENLPVKVTAKYDMAARHLLLATQYVSCGDTNNASLSIKKAWDALGDCGCGCSGSDQPTNPVPWP